MPPTTRLRIAVIVFLSLFLVVLTASYFFVRQQVRNRQPRLVEYVRLQFGLDCELADLDYAFPDGIRVFGLRITMANRPLLEAAEATFRIRVFSYLRHRSLHPRLLKSVGFQGLKIHLRRLPSGEWFLPALTVPSRGAGKTADGETFGGDRPKEAPIGISIRALELDIATPQATLKRNYEEL